MHPFLKILQYTIISSSRLHSIKQMDKNTNPVTLQTQAEDEYVSNPYEPSLIDSTDVSEITQPTVHHFLSWSMIPSLIACIYGVYHSWSLLQFAGAIVVGIPLTLAALMLNERERIKRQAKNRPVESTCRK